MATKSTAAAAKEKAAAAQAETNGKPHLIEFRGIELELPAQPTFAIVLAARRRSRAPEDDWLYGSIDLVEAYLGEEQAERLWAELGPHAVVESGEAVFELLGRFDEVYATDAGESSASPDS